MGAQMGAQMGAEMGAEMGVEILIVAPVFDQMAGITGHCAVWVKGGFQTITAAIWPPIGACWGKSLKGRALGAHGLSSQSNDEEQLG